MSKTNLKMGKPTYIINSEKGVVVCSIKVHGGIDCYHNLLINNDLTRKIIKKFHINWINQPQIFTAVAKLHKEDTWDEIKGKRIAESKCKRRIYKFYCRLYDFVISEILHNDIRLLNIHTDNLAYCLNRENRHLKELMK